jgi:hypothetical protein
MAIFHDIAEKIYSIATTGHRYRIGDGVNVDHDPGVT